MTSSNKTSIESLKEEIKRYCDSFGMLDSERAAHLGLPEGCRIRENAKILSQEKLQIGTNCWIGEGAILDASGDLEIGSHVSIGLNVMIWTHDSHQLNIRGQNTRDDNARIRRKKTTIGDNCFVAGPSVIMPGVTIGNRCIIGPMSVVYDDLPDRTVYTPYRDFQKLQDEITLLKQEIAALKNR